MSEINFFLPTEPWFRAQLRLVFIFIEIHYLAYEEGLLRSAGLDEITTLEEIKTISVQVREADPTKEIEVNSDFLLLLYAFVVIMNKILVSDMDEKVAMELVRVMPPDHEIRKFETFRDIALIANARLIEQVQEQAIFIEHFIALQQWLDQLEV